MWFALVLFFAQLVLGEVMRPKPQDAGKLSEFEAPTASEARPVPILWGTSILKSPNLLWEGDRSWKDISEEQKTGLIGTRKVIVAYSYYVGMLLGLCHGAVDALLQVRSNDKVLFNGNVVGAADGKKFTIACGQKIGQSFTSDNGILASDNGLVAACHLYTGGDAQQQSRYLKRFTGAATPGYRHISSVLIEGPSGALVSLASLSTPRGNPTDPVPPASQATWDAGALTTRLLFFGLGGGSGSRPFSGYGWSGNIGTNNRIGQYAFVLRRIPTKLLAGTADAAKSAIPSTPPVSHGGLSMATDPLLPAATSANQGWYYIVTATSVIPGDMGTRWVDYQNLPVHQRYLVGDYIFSNGRHWQHFGPGQAGFLTNGTATYNEANPAEMIFEILTSGRMVWTPSGPIIVGTGIGLPDSEIDFPFFRAAAVKLYNEGFGLSGVRDSKTTARQMITEILRYIDALLYRDLATGKFKLKLIRDDYDPDTVPTIDMDTVVDEGEISRGAWNETTNEVKVRFTDNAGNYRLRTVGVQDLANVDIQGAIVSTTIDYPFVTKAALANRLAARDLRALTYPLAKQTALRVNRKLYALQPGDVYKFVWPDYGLAAIYMRVTGRRNAAIKGGDDELDSVQDVFSLGQSAYSDIDPGGWDDPQQDPKLIVNYDLKPAPYHFTQDGTKQFIYSFAERPGPASLRYNVFSHKTGASISAPQRGTANIGNGSLGAASVGSATVTEIITVKCTSATLPATFSVTGSVSGSIGTATVGTPFTSTKANFTLTAGTMPFAVNDTFTLGTLVNDYGAATPIPSYTPTAILVGAYAANAGGVGPTDTAAVDSAFYDPANPAQFALMNAVDLYGTPAAQPAEIVAGNKNLAYISDPVNGDEIIAFQWPLRCNGVVGISVNWSPTLTGKGLLDEVLVDEDANFAEVWTLACTTGGGDGVGVFSVTGSSSGAAAPATVGTPYDNGQLAFTILDGADDFVAGDTFTLTCDPMKVGLYYFNQVWRGLLHTTARPHGAAARVWLLRNGTGIDAAGYGLTDAVKAKYGDLTDQRQMRLDEITPEQSVTFNSEPVRPYPPGDTRVNALPWPVEIFGATIMVSWVERNRLTQLSVLRQDDPTVTPEVGTTYTVKFYKLNNEATSAPFYAGTGSTWTLFKTFTGITAGTLSQVLTWAAEAAACGIGAGARVSSRHRMELYSTVGGLDSTFAQRREYDCAGFDMLFNQYFNG